MFFFSVFSPNAFHFVEVDIYETALIFESDIFKDRDNVLKETFLKKTPSLLHLLLTCHCTNTNEKYFYFPTSSEFNNKKTTGIALCIRDSDHEYSGESRKRNQKDLYYLMAYKYSTIFPRTSLLTNTSSTTSFCVDIYGKPTVSLFLFV